MRALLMPLFVYLLAAHSVWGHDAELVVGGHRIKVEIASTPEARAQGLMQRDFLCPDCGMLFIFEAPGRYAFWMNHTPLPLSIAFVTAGGSLLGVEEMQPNTTDPHMASGDALYALEMNAGWFARHHVTRGSLVQGLGVAPSLRQHP
jgi:uncharacterized membrane protein (UPF0127 family)